MSSRSTVLYPEEDCRNYLIQGPSWDDSEVKKFHHLLEAQEVREDKKKIGDLQEDIRRSELQRSFTEGHECIANTSLSRPRRFGTGTSFP